MRIVVDQGACIGAASCAVIAAKTFVLNGDGKVFIRNTGEGEVSRNEVGETVAASAVLEMDQRETIIEAARSCPVHAIKLFEDSGEAIAL